jgi:uncharacterized membrane protein YebE (DUF533 family)
MATQQTTTTSKQFSLNLNDFWKGFLMAIGGAIYGIILGTIQAESLTFDWKKIGIAALGAAVIYLGKNFFTQAKIVVNNATPETVEAVKTGDIEVKVDNTIIPPK